LENNSLSIYSWFCTSSFKSRHEQKNSLTINIGVKTKLNWLFTSQELKAELLFCHFLQIWWWLPEKGSLLKLPFQGHESTVELVMLSLNGTRIGSTSCNKACTWDVTTGLPYVPTGAQDHNNAFILSTIIMLYLCRQM